MSSQRQKRGNNVHTLPSTGRNTPSEPQRGNKWHLLLPFITKYTERTVWAESSRVNTVSFKIHVNPSVLKKIHVSLCFRPITQRLRIQDTCHSFHRLVSSLRHHSLQPWRLLEATVFPKHPVVMKQYYLPPHVFCKTNSSGPEAKTGGLVKMCERGLRQKFISIINSYVFVVWTTNGQEKKVITTFLQFSHFRSRIWRRLEDRWIYTVYLIK